MKRKKQNKVKSLVSKKCEENKPEQCETMDETEHQETEAIQEQIFSDPMTLSMFGSSVSVTVNEINPVEEELQRELPKLNKSRRYTKTEPSRLEKALKIAKSKMNDRSKPKRFDRGGAAGKAAKVSHLLRKANVKK